MNFNRYIISVSENRHVQRLFIGLFVLTNLFSAFNTISQPAQKTETIILKQEQQTFVPEEFYIADIVDKRKDKTAVAWLVSQASPGQIHKIDLQGGGSNAIKQYIKQGVPSNSKLRPIIIHINECRVVESPGEKGRVEGRVELLMSFYHLREEEEVHLVDYKGGVRYARSTNQKGAAEPALRRSLASSFVYLNNWINLNANNNEKLAKGIEVHFSDYTQNIDNDTIFYTSNRPLTWNDFTAKPRPSSNAAVIFSSFAYEGRSEIKEGVVHVYLTMKVFMVKSASWVRSGDREPYGLNHEQRHFDLTKLVAERFKQKIVPDLLTIEDYNSIIQYQYIESFREMNRLQDKYDSESRHSLDRGAQERWDRYIETELGKLAMKK